MTAKDTVSSLSTAKWIWSKDQNPNSYIAVKLSVKSDLLLENPRILIGATAKYKLYVNNAFVNAGPAPSRPPYVKVDEHALDKFVRPGDNTVLILAHHVGFDTKYSSNQRPGIIASFEALSKGLPLSFLSGPDWKIATLDAWSPGTPRRNWAIENVEELDLNRDSFAVLAENASCDYWAEHAPSNSQIWQTPEAFERPELILGKRLAPPLFWKIEELRIPRQIFRANTEIYNLQDTAVRLDHEHAWHEDDESFYEIVKKGDVQFERRPGEPGYLFLYDFKRMLAGDPAAWIWVEDPCTLDFAMAEDLRADGRPIVWRNGGLYFARYRLRPGINRIRFYHFNGYRFLYLSFKDAVGRVVIEKVVSHSSSGAVPLRDEFASNDREAESLYRISRRSLRLCAQASLYDCNTREQGTYWGDSLWVADSLGHMSGDFSFMKRLCESIPEEFESKGPLLPASLYGMGGPLLDYCLVPPEILRRYCRYTGDTSLLERALPAIEGTVSKFKSFRASADGLIHVSKIKDELGENAGLLFLDHSGIGWHPMTTLPIDRRDPSAGLNLFYLQAVMALAELRTISGYDAQALDAEADELKFLIRKRFLVPAKGLLADSAVTNPDPQYFSQIVNSLAIMLGVLEAAEIPHALKTILDIGRNPWISQGTPYSYFFLAEASAIAGKASESVSMFSKAYAKMISRGATTSWESWNADNHDSRNHAWSAAFPYLVRRAVMGLSPLSPGYSEVLLKPDFEAFDSVRAKFAIPQGCIEVEWCLFEPEILELKISAPPSVKMSLGLPGGELVEFTSSWKGKTCRSIR